ncbi:MAG TPA: hypothetical protein VI168_13560 [Croceibacterium sp.]
MERQGDEVHFETDEARGATSPNIVRWILAIGLFAAIALLSVIWITGAATQGAVEGEGTAEGRERVSQEYGSRGGVLASDADDLDAPAPGDTAEPGAPPTVENDAADEPAPAEPAAN